MAAMKLGQAAGLARAAGLLLLLLGAFSLGLFVGYREIVMTDNVSYYANRMAVFTQQQQQQQNNHQPKVTPESQQVQWDDVFRFLPNDLRDCRQLFEGARSTRNLSRSHAFTRRVFRRLWETHRNNASYVEGHVGECPEQSRTYYELARQDFVENICEIGFNAGHSTLLWLTSNERAHVYSFDLGQYRYTRLMANFLRAQFPGRLTMLYGDSALTVPIFSQLGPLCDLLVIDGGHTYDAARLDLRNMKALANPLHHVLVFDDYPSTRYDFSAAIGRAWNESIAEGDVAELFACTYEPDRYRGFSVGRYIA